MPQTVAKQTRSCLGCSAVIAAAVLGVIFYHRYVWREKEAPDLAYLNRLRMSQIGKAYFLFYQENQRYPENFEELTSPKNYVPGAEHDVWTSQYRILEDQGTAYLYSFGPDKTDDQMQIAYDPTNGADSRGDQKYVLRRRGTPDPPVPSRGR